MQHSPAGGPIDCDLHPVLPNWTHLSPYLPAPWLELLSERGMKELVSAAYPPNSPITVRSDWRDGGPSSVEGLRRQALDPFGTAFAICNCLYPLQMQNSEDFAAVYASAINDWLAREWLDKEPHLRASIVVPMQNPQMAADEIERCAGDRRFVQVLLLANGDMPLGKRYHWPIYAAAARHGLPVCIHAGGAYHHPPTPNGWPTYHTEEYVAHAQSFQQQLTSLICEGVFSKYPNLKVVLAESGFTWLPGYLWRLTKYWQALRIEIPWVDRSPADIVRTNVRFTLQPFDAPPERGDLLRLLDHFGSDELLLFSTDYPHAQFEGQDALPEGLGAELVRKITIENPMQTYPRIKEALS